MIWSVQCPWTEFTYIIFGPQHGKASYDRSGASFSEVPTKEAACSKCHCSKMVVLPHILNHWVAAYGSVHLVSYLDTSFTWINYKCWLLNPLKFCYQKGNIFCYGIIKKFSSSSMHARDMNLSVFFILSLISVISDITCHLVDSISCLSSPWWWQNRWMLHPPPPTPKLKVITKI